MSRRAPKFEVSDEVVDQIEEHCFSEVSHEVGGFLVGTVVDGRAQVTGAIKSTKAQSQQTSLTFTHEAWDEAYQAMATDHPDKQLVGWYHSHPGFGVFMSDWDGFIQENFFSGPGQLALVVDPLKGRSGWFTWKNKAVAKVSESDTKREALGGNAEDYAAPVEPRVMQAKFSLESVPPQAVVVGIVALLIFATLAFVIGQKQGNSSTQGLAQQNSIYRAELQDYQTLYFSAPFETADDTVKDSSVVYVRYYPQLRDTAFGPWADFIAGKFGTTTKSLLAANPGLVLDAAVPPESLIVPIRGWRVPPPPIATPEPTASATPSPSGSSTPAPTKTGKTTGAKP